jgi:hypothetical protein
MVLESCSTENYFQIDSQSINSYKEFTIAKFNINSAQMVKHFTNYFVIKIGGPKMASYLHRKVHFFSKIAQNNSTKPYF